MIIVLCGFKGCGKSVVGRALANIKGVPFVDLDALIEQHFCKDKPKQLTFRQIYKLIGAIAFRNLEKAVLAQFEPKGDVVFSVGGGTLMDSENKEILKQLGQLVYLQVEDDLLFSRIMADGIPATFDASNPRGSFDKLLSERQVVFEKTCETKVNLTHCSVDQAAQAVLSAVAND